MYTRKDLVTEPKCKFADDAGNCDLRGLRCPCFDHQMCIPCNIPIDGQCRICEFRINKTMTAMKTPREIARLIFLRLMKNHNIITPDMQLHIEEVLEEELSQPLTKTEKTEDELDLIQYVTNLLYFAHTDGTLSNDEFDKWVEQKTNELIEYYTSQFTQPEISDDRPDLECDDDVFLSDLEEEECLIELKNTESKNAEWRRLHLGKNYPHD